MSEADNKLYTYNNLDSDWFDVILHLYCIEIDLHTNITNFKQSYI